MASATLKRTPFTGSFLFVNHDAGNLDARPHRQDVFTHVQSQYRKWNRQERTRALLASAKVPSGPLRRLRLAAKEEDSARGGIDSVTEPDPDVASEAAKTKVILRESKATAVLKGNSDPFETQAVAITPEVNELITFFRDLVIPSIYHTGPDGWKTSQTANAHWQSAVQGLGDKGGALGFLARYAQVAAITGGDKRMGTEALRYTSKSTSVLRERLEHSTTMVQQANPLSQKVYWQINMLWGTEILFRNVDAAVTHGKMLRRILEKQSMNKQLDATFLRYVLYNDSHLICSFMIRSVFDYDSWIPEQYKTMEAAATAEMPNLDEVHAQVIDPSVESDFLKQIFTTRREHVEVWKQRVTSPGISPLMYAWLATDNSIHQGQLVKHALDAMDMAEKASSENAGGLWAEAYLSLASLYWIRCIGGSMIVRGVDIYDAQRPILEKLRISLRRADETQTAKDRSKYQHAKLWTLFVGAQTEQSWRRPGWFNKSLVALGKEMGVVSWTALREILNGFLYTDMLPPHGSTWYEKTIRQGEEDK